VPNGNYNLLVKDTNNCSASANFTINYTRENCEDEVFVPQGFSPNGDGINDAYSIEGIEKYPENYLRIYNRWGTLVFEEKGYKNTWEGTSETGIGSNGERLPTGTYFYILELIPGKEAKSGYLYISK
jgi:gliding motility-associated-like protein